MGLRALLAPGDLAPRLEPLEGGRECCWRRFDRERRLVDAAEFGRIRIDVDETLLRIGMSISV
jgi:hypothetical protein